MAKDPAFLFYPGDYISGTMGMTFEQKGAYIELLMLQFNRGHMTTDMIGQTVGQLWGQIQDKFIQDGDGLYYNERLDEEKQKRKDYTASRRNNISGNNQHTKKSGHTTPRMEDEDVNKDSIEYRKERFVKDCAVVNEQKQILTNEGMTNENGNGFLDYWMEMGPRDKKMRFEKQASFDPSRRMKMWARNNKKWNTDSSNRYIVGDMDYKEKWNLNQE